MADEGQVSGDAAADAAASTDAQPDVDVDALKTAILSASEQAALTTELTNLKRAAGHVPELQKKVGAVEAALSRLPALEQSNKALQERVDALIAAFPDGLIPERAIAGLRAAPTDTNAAVLAKLAELEGRLSAPTQTPADEDPALTARKAELSAAQESVNAYATKHSFDVNSIPDAVYQRALSANGNDTVLATLDVIRYIDQQVAASARRGERKDAGTGGNAPRAARSGPVTVEMLKTMTAADIMKIPEAERMAALSGS